MTLATMQMRKSSMIWRLCAKFVTLQMRTEFGRWVAAGIRGEAREVRREAKKLEGDRRRRAELDEGEGNLQSRVAQRHKARVERDASAYECRKARLSDRGRKLLTL